MCIRDRLGTLFLVVVLWDDGAGALSLFQGILVAEQEFVPVSYTHLDVYKRQAVTGDGRELPVRTRAVRMVSYTHDGNVGGCSRDVYKRQDRCFARGCAQRGYPAAQ